MMIELALLSCAIGGLFVLLKVQWKKSLFEKKLLNQFLFLLIGWICFSLLLGLFQTFGALEVSKEDATSKIFLGLQVSASAILLGLVGLLVVLYFFGRKAQRNTQS
jgi:membrane associated rhomboid family serine protease